MSVHALTVAIREAREAGMEVVMGDSFHLLLDIDSPESLAHYESFMGWISKDLALVEESRWRSKSGNWHIVVRSERYALSVSDRIALQACLGSDLKHEVLSMMSYLNPCVLFKPQ